MKLRRPVAPDLPEEMRAGAWETADGRFQIIREPLQGKSGRQRNHWTITPALGNPNFAADGKLLLACGLNGSYKDGTRFKTRRDALNALEQATSRV